MEDQTPEILSPETDTELNQELVLAAKSYTLDATYKTPEQIIEEATKCAKLLKHIMSKKPNPVVVNDEIYPEYEDWLIAARFYGCTPKITETHYTTEYGAVGFEATAELIRSDGTVISRAEGMCLMDEPRWSGKPLYAIKSMAQTRAGAKVMRQVFSWILVLAGYKPTPAEEIKDIDITPKTKLKVNFVEE